MIDRRHGNGVQIDARRPAADAVVDVHERALMLTLAVDEHEHLIRAESSSVAGRTVSVPSVIDGRGKFSDGAND